MRASNMSSPSPASPNRALRAAVLAAVALAAGADRPAAAAEQIFDCVIDPAETVKVGSPIAGILSEVLVKRGDVITRNQEIARLESSVEAATVAYNRFRAESTARIDAQKQRLALANARLERNTELVKTKIVSQDRFEELRADAAVAKQELLREEQERR